MSLFFNKLLAFKQLSEYSIGLHGELPGRGDDDDASAVVLFPVQLVEQLNGRNEEGQRLARARLRRRQHVFALNFQRYLFRISFRPFEKEKN